VQLSRLRSNRNISPAASSYAIYRWSTMVFFAFSKRAQSDRSANPRIEAFRDPFDHASLTGRITPRQG
jgi:hypothetical protein